MKNKFDSFIEYLFAVIVILEAIFLIILANIVIGKAFYNLMTEDELPSESIIHEIGGEVYDAR